MSFPRYEKYKASGVEWLGDVPAHWGVVPLGKLTFSRCDGPFGSGLKSEHYTDNGVRVIRLQNIRVTGFDGSDCVYVDPGYFARELTGHEVKGGDLLIAGLGDDNSCVGRACVAPGDISPAIVKADCFRFRLDVSRCLPSFAALALNTSSLADAGILSSGSTRARIPLSTMGTRCIPLPPVDEQVAITTFLACEIAKLDTLVGDQQRLIELLKEKRQAVISHAVTKGLNPNAKMKPSGVEWLGDVPAHWDVMPIRKAAKLESGHTPSRSRPDYWVNCTVPWFTLADVWQIREAGRDYIHETKEKVSEVGLANSSARLLPRGTVMLSRTASVGFSAIMGIDMATTQDFANWVCGPSLKSEFLLQVLRSMADEFRRMMMGSTHNTIYMPDIQGLRFALPPLSEQEAIVAFLSRERDRIDSLIAEAERAVLVLQERRTALISAAVTGQIDVRAIACEVA